MLLKINDTQITQFLNLQNLDLVNKKSLQTIIDVLKQILHIDLTKAPLRDCFFKKHIA